MRSLFVFFVEKSIKKHVMIVTMFIIRAEKFKRDFYACTFDIFWNNIGICSHKIRKFFF